MKSLTILILPLAWLGLTTALVRAGEADAADRIAVIREIRVLGEKERKARIASLQDKLRSWQTAANKGTGSRRSRDSQKSSLDSAAAQWIDYYRKEIQGLHRLRDHYLPTLTWKVDGVGVFRGPPPGPPRSTPATSGYSVGQGRQIDPSRVYLGPPPASVQQAQNAYPQQLEVLQVIDDQQVLVRVHRDTLWINGWSTAGVVDGAQIELDGIFRITGTTTYTTPIGSSNTVFVAELLVVRPEEVRGAVADRRSQERTSRQTSTRPAQADAPP